MKPNASSLFHFTKTIDVFKLIIEKGLRYSFAFESFPDSIIENTFCHGLIQNLENDNLNQEGGIALPMVSFCDIPLMRTDEHSIRYGKYAVGINVDFLTHFYKEFINPVIYVDSSNLVNSIKQLTRAEGIAIKSLSLIAQSGHSEDATRIRECILLTPQDLPQVIKKTSSEIKEIYEAVAEFKFAIDTILSLYKPTYGKNVDGEMQSFYNEREWRAIWPNTIDTDFEWQIGCRRDGFKSIKDTLNSNLNNNKDAFITIPGEWFNMITHIIVPTEEDILDISNHILHSKKLLGYTNIVKNQRLHLLTKLTSFERIQNDY